MAETGAFGMTDLYITLSIIALATLVLGSLSEFLDRYVVPAPLLAAGAGIAAGPVGLGLVQADAWPHQENLLQEAARLTIALSVVGIALRTPLPSWRKALRPTLLLLTAGMGAMWLVASLLAAPALVSGLWATLLLGACVTPTDPVVASAIVSSPVASQSLPDQVRSTLSLESGANDGLGYLFVMLPVLALEPAAQPFREWLVQVLILDVLRAVLLGCAIGSAAGGLVRVADHYGLAEPQSYGGLTIAMAALALGAARLVEADGILAAFAAGAAFCFTAHPREVAKEKSVHETLVTLTNVPIFLLFGLLLPWSDWAGAPWAFAAFAVLVALLRRPLAVLLLLRPLRRDLDGPGLMFIGWFGPVGVAAMFYGLEATSRTADRVYWAGAAAAVMASLLAHGLTAAGAMAAMRRRAQTKGPGT